LLTYDAVSFNQFLETVLISNTPAPGSTRQNHSPWLFLEAAHTVFSVAKERVYVRDTLASEAMDTLDEVPKDSRIVLEEQAKWRSLKEILDEIEHDIHLNPREGSLPLNIA
jgi:DNA excision repair protein ERCC-4